MDHADTILRVTHFLVNELDLLSGGVGEGSLGGGVPVLKRSRWEEEWRGTTAAVWGGEGDRNDEEETKNGEVEWEKADISKNPISLSW